MIVVLSATDRPTDRPIKNPQYRNIPLLYSLCPYHVYIVISGRGCAYQISKRLRSVTSLANFLNASITCVRYPI